MRGAQVHAMTSRDRIEAALKHREPDRTPIFEYVLRSPREGVLSVNA